VVRDSSYHGKKNDSGGKSYFIGNPTTALVTAALDDAMTVYDVEFESDPVVKGSLVTDGKFSYIHKVKDGSDVYFFANSSSNTINTIVKLRGEFATLQCWNPHTGTVSNAAYTMVAEANQKVTKVQLSLPPVNSVFLRGTAATSASDLKPGR